LSSSRHRLSDSRARGSSPHPQTIHARGRFFATPGRRGKRSGVGPVFLRRMKPGGLSSTAAASFEAARSTAARSALGPTKSTARPPDRTSGRHHSAATGGAARALASPVPYASRPTPAACSSARSQTTETFSNSSVVFRRKSHLRRFDSSSTKSRSGRVAASGIPGEPPPEPTSTTGPSPRSAAAAKAPWRSVSRASS
jgi:hypothetical protein